jgi:hypothetical protein
MLPSIEAHAPLRCRRNARSSIQTVISSQRLRSCCNVSWGRSKDVKARTRRSRGPASLRKRGTTGPQSRQRIPAGCFYRFLTNCHRRFVNRSSTAAYTSLFILWLIFSRRAQALVLHRLFEHHQRRLAGLQGTCHRSSASTLEHDWG